MANTFESTGDAATTPDGLRARRSEETRALAGSLRAQADDAPASVRALMLAAADRMTTLQASIDAWSNPDTPNAIWLAHPAYRVVPVSQDERETVAYAWDESVPRNETYGGWVVDGCEENGQNYLYVCLDEEVHRADLGRVSRAWSQKRDEAEFDAPAP